MTNVLPCYSNIVIFLNFFPLGHAVNTALYLSICLCFLANIVIMVRDPYLLGTLVEGGAFRRFNLPTLHVLNQVYHIAPILWFRQRQTFRETVSNQSFLLGIFFFVSYLFFLSDRTISDIYGMNKATLLFIVFCVGAFVKIVSLAV